MLAELTSAPAAIAGEPPLKAVANEPRAAGLLTRPLGAWLALLAAVFVIYAPSLNGQFLWDDLMLIKNNYLIRSPLFCLEVFRHTLFNDDSNFYRPTQTLTFLADYWFGGLNPFSYHLTSILIHAVNAGLLCLTLRRVLPVTLRGALERTQTDLLALGIALVWAVHPVHSAAVAYASGTADTLAMMFCLLGALLCERALEVGSRKSERGSRKFAVENWRRGALGVGAFACLIFGLCAKEIASIWLLLFLGYLCLLRADVSRRARWTVAGLAGVALAVYVGLRHLTPAPPVPPPLPPMPSKWLLMLRALGDYGSLLLFPNKLFMERQVFAAPGLANAPDEFFYNTLAVTGALLALGLAAGCRWRGRGRTLRRVGAAWFLIAFLPISNLFSLNASVAEHWLYLPSIGFLLFLAGVGLDVPMLAANRRGARTALIVGLMVVVGALGLRTWFRTFDWTDELTFFRQTIADGGDVPRARAGLAVAYGRMGINEHNADADNRSIAVLRDMARRSPGALAVRINLGLALARQGRVAEAKEILEAVTARLTAQGTRDPREITLALKSLGELNREDAGWPARQQTLLNRGLQRFPHDWELVKYAAQESEQRGDAAAGLARVQHYADAHWWHSPARYMAGSLQAELNRADAALGSWREASRLDVHDVESLSSAAGLCLRLNRLNEAHEWQARAVDREPDSPRQHAFFAAVLERQGDTRGAQAQMALANGLLAEGAGR